jgi:hypothetical protein
MDDLDDDLAFDELLADEEGVADSFGFLVGFSGEVSVVLSTSSGRSCLRLLFAIDHQIC